MSKDKNIEETSSVAGGSSGGFAQKSQKKRKMPKEYYLSRKEFIEEAKLRNVIREVAKKKSTSYNDDNVLRDIIRKLISETKKDVEEAPHSSTAINLLEDLLKSILPNLETEFKTLTTAKIQRDSFRAHVVSAVSTLLETESINKKGGDLASEEALISLDEEDSVEEEVDIKVSDVDASAEDKFIDIDAKPEEPEPEDTFGIEGQDETGRALAQDAFNNIEKNIAETYAILHDDEDEKLFEDYLITNLKLYFDKWEKELGAVTEPTTDEYEAEKDQNAAGPEAGAEFDAELGDELGGGIPAAGTGEELVQ
jgi:hypothetical protein